MAKQVHLAHFDPPSSWSVKNTLKIHWST